MENKIGENIKELRKKRGITQKELAEKCNLATITIRQYETGKREPKLETIIKIAIALGVSPNELIDLNNSNDPIVKEIKDKKARILVADRKYIDSVLDSTSVAYVAELTDLLHKKEDYQERFWILLTNFNALNKEAQLKGIEYFCDLNKIPEYKRDDFIEDPYNE